MFAPEIRLLNYETYKKAARSAKVKLATLNLIRYHTRLQLQAYDGVVVWSYTAYGIEEIADVFGVSSFKFRVRERLEGYDDYEFAKLEEAREYFDPHFQAWLDADYKEGHFTSLALVAQEGEY